MAFATFEELQEGGQPVELYTFTIGSAVTRYTSSEDTITVSSNDYTAVSIERDRIVAGGPEQRSQQMTLIMPGNDAIVSQYFGIPPGVSGDLVIERVQRLDGPSYQVIKIFEGKILSITTRDNGRRAEMILSPVISAVSRVIPRFKYSSLCNHILYDDRCQVSDTDPSFKLSSKLVTAESGTSITVTDAGLQADGYYTGGFVETTDQSDRRAIRAHVGDTLTLHIPFSSSVLSTNVNVFAGCDHTQATCKSKFNNVINYGGFPHVPTKNIFQTGLTN